MTVTTEQPPRAPRPRTDPRPGPRTPLLLRPLASYHLLLGCTVLLLALGLVMVFSASSLRSYATTGSVFSTGIKQATFIAFGVPLMMVLSRLPVRVFRAAAYPSLVVSVGLLVLVLFVGRKVNGATSWIPLPAGFNLQPAELAKLALVLWGADLLVRKHKRLGDPKHLLIPLLPVAGLVLGLVMLQPDLGTSVTMASIVVALLFVVGTPLRMFGGLCGFLLACVALLAVSSPHSMRRLVSFRDPFADAGNTGYQAVQGFYALSSGGVFGRGLGASREKWSGGLPEAHTDYVFAIIGEELGLLGTLAVLVLFAVLLYSGIRIAQRATDPFVRLCSFAVTAWLGGQAVINMGAVVGLLPITGLPLPLVSFGGSAMLVTLAAIGMLLSFARLEPGAAAALRARPSVLGRLRGGTAPLPRQRTAVSSRAARPPARRPSGRREVLSVVLAGGGTAGHVEPALTLADALVRRDPATRCTFLGTATGLEARLVPARGYPLAEVPRVPLPRRPTPDLLRVPGRVLGAVRATRAHLDRVDADVVVGFGGYVALPAYLAARRRGTPFVVHEANARAGLANRVGARLTRHVAAAVEDSGLAGATVLGIPLRTDVSRLDRAAARDAARASFGLGPGPVLLVTGGSQGARAVNTALAAAAPDLAAAGVQVLHVAGPRNADDVRAAVGDVPTHHVLAYVDGMHTAYAAADLVVCRAGAMTCAELAAVGLPAVYVPLPIGNGEQALNAGPVVAAGGGLLVADADLDATWVRAHVLPLLADPARLAAMSEAAGRTGHRDADEALADLVLAAAGGAR